MEESDEDMTEQLRAGLVRQTDSLTTPRACRATGPVELVVTTRQLIWDCKKRSQLIALLDEDHQEEEVPHSGGLVDQLDQLEEDQPGSHSREDNLLREHSEEE